MWNTATKISKMYTTNYFPLDSIPSYRTGRLFAALMPPLSGFLPTAQHCNVYNLYNLAIFKNAIPRLQNSNTLHCCAVTCLPVTVRFYPDKMEQAKRLLRELAETNNAMQSNEIFNLATRTTAHWYFSASAANFFVISLASFARFISIPPPK